jgi:hypothetical protein
MRRLAVIFERSAVGDIAPTMAGGKREVGAPN